MDDAESGEEYFREVEGGMAPFVKLDRRRRLRHGFAEIERLHAYTLSDGEGAEEEEEAMEVDEETQPPVAAVSAAMAHGQAEHEPGATRIAAGGFANDGLRDARSESRPTNTFRFLVRPIRTMTRLRCLFKMWTGMTWTRS